MKKAEWRDCVRVRKKPVAHSFRKVVEDLLHARLWNQTKAQ